MLLILPGQAGAGDPGAPPLGDGRVTHLEGVVEAGGRRLRVGDAVTARQVLRVADEPEARLELRFADGSLVRLGPRTELTVEAAARRVLLRHGRLLVQADRMIGGIATWTPLVVLEPLGTTYVVDAAAEAVSVLVLEGAVQVIRPPTPPERVLLPGEAAHIPPRGERLRTSVRVLLEAIQDEPLVAAFSAPLPSLARIRDLGDQQRRGLLAGRNERLRRELGWRRPPRKPIVLPELFR